MDERRTNVGVGADALIYCTLDSDVDSGHAGLFIILWISAQVTLSPAKNLSIRQFCKLQD